MATSSCQAGCLYRSRGGAVGVGEDRRSLRRCLLQVPGWFWAHTILREGGGSSDAAAAAAAASTAGTLVELERVVPIAPSPTREGGEKKKSQQRLLMLASEAASDAVTRKMDSVCSPPSFQHLLLVSAWWVGGRGATFLIYLVIKWLVYIFVA